jgi:hypothetical protein
VKSLRENGDAAGWEAAREAARRAADDVCVPPAPARGTVVFRRLAMRSIHVRSLA